MADWKSVLLQIASNAEDQFDEFKLRLRRKLAPRPIMILPYLGHGTRNMLYLRGRVLEDKQIVSAKDNDTIWQNLIHMYRRYESDEIPHARIRATFGDHVTEVTADEEGFFEIRITPDKPLPADKIVYDIDLELLDFPQHRDRHPEELRVVATGQVIVPPPNAQFGVISDMDDTVIKTDVLDLIKMARNTFLHNSRTRLPFEGVAAFYQALQKGVGTTFNPIFYVSSSPWNLYDLFMDFFDVRGIPIGPMFLKDLGITPDQFLDSGHRAHKSAVIQMLLDTHPELPFVLVGDSGQRDPEIYAEIAHKNPGRIKAIYIRDVTMAENRDREVLRLADQLNAAGVLLKLTPDTVGAAEDAVVKGFIPEDAMLTIRIERTEDQKEPEKIEKLLDPKAEPQELYNEPAPDLPTTKGEKAAGGETGLELTNTMSQGTPTVDDPPSDDR